MQVITALGTNSRVTLEEIANASIPYNIVIKEVKAKWKDWFFQVLINQPTFNQKTF